MTLAALQRAMMRALLEPDAPAPPGLLPPAHLQIHRRNLESSLTEALRAIYPVVDRLVGDACFERLAQTYLRLTPPREPRLFAYGADFAAFLATHPAVQALSYLPDVARLEWAWNEAFHAAADGSLTAAELAALPPAALPAWRPRLIASARLLASTFPVDRIHAANQPEAEDAAVDLDAGGVRLIVLRPRASVLISPLSPAGFAIARAATAGHSLDAILAEVPAGSIGPALAELLDLGALAAPAAGVAARG